MRRTTPAGILALLLGAAPPAIADEAAIDRAADGLTAERDCVIGPDLEVDVSAAVPGLLARVTVDRSDTVRAGQVLARLESEVERAALALAEAWASLDSEIRLEEVARAREHRREARIERLYARRAVALDDREGAQTEAEIAGLRLRQAREKRWIRALDADRARATLERRTVRSPIDGVVVERYRVAGEYVENEPVVRVARLDPLQVETILPLRLFGQVRPGLVAEVRPEHDPGTARRAVVTRVDRVGDAASGTFGVRLSLPNPGHRLPAGLRCTLRFVPGEKAPVPTPGAPSLAAGAERPGAGPAGPPPAAASREESRVAPPAPPDAGPSSPETPVRAPDAAPGLADAALAGAGSDDPGTPPSAKPCAAIGPFESEAAAGAAVDLLAAGGIASRAVVRARTERVGFLVATPRQPGIEQAAALAGALGRAGVRDRQVLVKGDFAGRVALGAYDSVATADRRRAALAALGVEAEVLERTRTDERWWVTARVDGARSVGARLAGAGGPNVVVETVECPAAELRRAHLVPGAVAPRGRGAS